MDIWEWVGEATGRLREKGQPELADAVVSIPGLAVGGEPGTAEGLASQIINPLRQHGESWLEIFVRHSLVAGRLLRFGVGEPLREEMEELLELARRPENADCPQSTCAVHDHTLNLSNIDGPGHAAERVTALEEILPRIDATWSCYALTIVEYSKALVDAGRPGDALARVDESIEAMQDAPWELYSEKARILCELGRYDEALDTLSAVPTGESGEDPTPLLSRQVLIATAHAGAGRPQEALAAFPSPDDIGPRHSLWLPWARTYERLVAAEVVPNSWQVGTQLRDWADALDQVGAHRPCLELTLLAGRLAIKREARWVTGRLLLLAEAKLAGLVSAESMAKEVEQLKGDLDALPLAEPSEPAEQLAARFDSEEDQTSPEAWIDLLEVPVSRDAGLATRMAMAMAPTGHVGAAIDVLWGAFEKEPGDAEAGQMLSQLLLQRADDEGIERLAAAADGPAPLLHHSLLAQWHFANDRFEQAAEHCERFLDLQPGNEGVLRLWAESSRRDGEWVRAQELFRHLADAGEAGSDERRNDLLSLAVCATAVHDWDAVRTACAEIGVTFSTAEGPIDEDWGPIHVVVPGPDGEPRPILATRTGPATARLLLPQPAGSAFNTGDLMVIEPRPMAEPDDPENPGDFIVPFPAIATMEEAGFTSYFFDGAYPGDTTFDQFQAEIRSRGWDIGRYSPPEYTITSPDGEELTGVYGWIALPPNVDPSIAEGLLDDFTEGWDHPLAWVELARAARVDVPYHEKIIKDYGL